jgi:hypothetical protein
MQLMLLLSGSDLDMYATNSEGKQPLDLVSGLKGRELLTSAVMAVHEWIRGRGLWNRPVGLHILCATSGLANIGTTDEARITTNNGFTPLLLTCASLFDALTPPWLSTRCGRLSNFHQYGLESFQSNVALKCITSLVVDLNSDVNARTSTGWTALTLLFAATAIRAVIGKDVIDVMRYREIYDIADFFIRSGADLAATTDEGYSAMTFAACLPVGVMYTPIPLLIHAGAPDHFILPDKTPASARELTPRMSVQLMTKNKQVLLSLVRPFYEMRM